MYKTVRGHIHGTRHWKLIILQSDPRSFIVRKTADEVFKVYDQFSCQVSGSSCILCSTGKDELLETAMALHEAAMKDEYFIKRKLAPNVDFWCVHDIMFYMCPS